MSYSNEWLGRADDLTLEYDVGISKNALLVTSDSIVLNLPVLVYPEIDNIREILEIEWVKEVKKADKTDYLLSIACGSIAGLIDSFFVGEMSLEKAEKWGRKQINAFVKQVARINGYKGKTLTDAVLFLEKQFPMAADKVAAEFGGGNHHHLRDFSHHFSLGGLLCSLFTQFTGKVLGTDVNGKFIIVKLADDYLIGSNFEEKILFGTVRWFLHLVSDMAGSNKNAGSGTGIPGPIGSLIKELSALPMFTNLKIKDRELYIWAAKLFNGTFLNKRDENGNLIQQRFDLRAEIGLLQGVVSQTIPIIINECLVRTVYFIRRFYLAVRKTDIKSSSDFRKIDCSQLVPFNNRIIRRMVTVSSGTFVAVDSADALIRAAIINRDLNPKIVVDFAVRINYPGIGRFIVACKADANYIIEDVQAIKARRNAIKRDMSARELNCLTLNYEQMRVLLSLEYLMLKHDLANSKGDNKFLKGKWDAEWRKRVVKDIPVIDEGINYFMTENELLEYFSTNDITQWHYLILLEALMFLPYVQLFGNEADAEYEKLKFNRDYLDIFSNKIDNRIKVSDLKKEYNKATTMIKKSKTEKLVNTGVKVGSVAVAAALAFEFAPSIAVWLVGDAATGLSGAALINHALATIGGGSLALGGFGMTGGTAFITSGGAFLGLIGGTGTSKIAFEFLSNGNYVLTECSKLLTFCRAVLFDQFEDNTTIIGIYDNLSLNINEFNQHLNKLSDDATNEKNNKVEIKEYKTGLKYLENTCKELRKLIKHFDNSNNALMLEGKK